LLSEGRPELTEVRTVLPDLLKELSDAQLIQTFRFVLHTLGCDNSERVEATLHAASNFELSHLVHIAARLRKDSLTELVFLAEELLRAEQSAARESVGGRAISPGQVNRS
jgi:hypothetical protein